MSEREEFINKISEQIKSEEDYGRQLEEGKRRLHNSKYLILLPFAVLAASALYHIFNYTENSVFNPGVILLLWIIGSFITYMNYFFIMMIPSIGTNSKPAVDIDFKTIVRQFLKLANLLKTVNNNKITFLHLFLDSMIINTKPVAAGFVIMYAVDVIFAVILTVFNEIDVRTMLIILIQITLIILYYWRITKAKPGAPGFFTGIKISGGRISEVPGPKKYLLVLSSAIFFILTAAILLGAMYLPGFTYKSILDEISVNPIWYPAMAVSIIVFQWMFIRWINGRESRKQMAVLNKNHIDVLKNELLSEAENCSEDMIPKLKRKFLIFSMNKLIVQEFIYRFPVYSIMPNYFLIFDPDARRILNEDGGENKTIAEGLREIL
ncbi:MAG TPA: hypothetical protein O0W90_01610 [Methanocorpusculum sp.]|nr:hypothetical protein [Methanocorpusculum sp.]